MSPKNSGLGWEEGSTWAQAARTKAQNPPSQFTWRHWTTRYNSTMRIQMPWSLTTLISCLRRLKAKLAVFEMQHCLPQAALQNPWVSWTLLCFVLYHFPIIQTEILRLKLWKQAVKVLTDTNQVSTVDKMKWLFPGNDSTQWSKR